MPWEETDDTIRSGHGTGEYETCRNTDFNGKLPKGIQAVYCKRPGKDEWFIQSFIFSKEQGWTMDKAKQWFSEHQGIAEILVEKFEWAMPFRFYATKDGLIIRGTALHPGRTINRNIYTDEELLRGARSMIGTRLEFLNHGNWMAEGNDVLDAEYSNGEVEYIARVVDPIAVEKIKNGEINHVSINAVCRKAPYISAEGHRSCEGLIFNGLCLVHRDERTGDPGTTLQVWEKIVDRLNQIHASRGGSKAEVEKMSEMLEKRLGEMEATVKSMQQWIQTREQEDERERQREAQRERAQKYGISPKEGGNLTKPSEYEGLSDDQFADPVNYRYPIDKEHVRPALTYFNQADNRQAGGYTHEEAVKIMTKIINAALNAGIEVSYQSEDPVYRDLSADLKSKLAGYEAKEKAPPSGVGIVKPVGTITTEPEPIKVEEIEAIIMDRKLFTPALKIRGILDLVERKRRATK